MDQLKKEETYYNESYCNESIEMPTRGKKIKDFFDYSVFGLDVYKRQAFYACSELQFVEWNCKCNEISDYCFCNCTKLKQFEFLGIQKIGRYALDVYKRQVHTW